MRTGLICAALVASVGLFPGCDHPMPAAPGSFPNSPPPVVTPTTTRASLIIEQLSITLYPQTQGDKYAYEPRFQLREASGNSGATVTNIAVVASNGGSDNTGPSCWRETLRVPPGGVLDAFFTDAGAAWLGYCAPWSGGNSATPDLRVVVTFTDDEGHPGTVESRTTAIR